MDMPSLDLFLPYQRDWLNDKSRLKIWEKSRRCGGTWTQSFEDVLDCTEKPGLAVYFSSADLTAADEYIRDCSAWIRGLNASIIAISQIDASEIEGLEIADEGKGLKATMVEFQNGSRIVALSSSPTAFRSKGGKIVWDEAAHHKAAAEMWAAAAFSAMWGYDIRIISTHHGVNSTFNQLIKKIRERTLKGSVHKITLPDAVESGLLDKILGRPSTEAEREEFVENEHNLCLTEDVWQEECMCNPQDEASSYLSYRLIDSCMEGGILADPRKCRGPLYLAQDVARRRHLSIIVVAEDVGGRLVTRAVDVLVKKRWTEQEKILWGYLALPNMVRACIDATGLGDQYTERAQEQYGSMVEAVRFTGPVKESLAIQLDRELQDCRIAIPDRTKIELDLDGGSRPIKKGLKRPKVKLETLLRESLHSVKKVVTAAGNARYDAKADENGHGDAFWSFALLSMAARNPDGGRPDIRTESADKAETEMPLGIPGGIDPFAAHFDVDLGGFDANRF
ncbi:MAG: terminase family protein [Sphaerochaetaceae bacterium]